MRRLAIYSVVLVQHPTSIAHLLRVSVLFHFLLLGTLATLLYLHRQSSNSSAEPPLPVLSFGADPLYQRSALRLPHIDILPRQSHQLFHV
ncbi:hypothetical protein EJ08DRAFT_327158 [Tothia fuscella]|uniref:Uncharacterized protein n=1 Tax=Tothia fuscella TaxID=1048955 RepID=A0A9P4TWV9_9PEZI|nr:hypothetical protein EJ08DRAFT_327158 [Tothia fuscella]